MGLFWTEILHEEFYNDCLVAINYHIKLLPNKIFFIRSNCFVWRFYGAF